MRSVSIERLLRKILFLRFLTLLFQFALIITSASLAWKLLIGIADRYLFYHPLAATLICGALFLILIARCFASYLSDSAAKLASQLDHHYALKERIITYVQLRGADHPFLPALIHDTEQKLTGVSAVRAAQIHRGMAAPLLILAVLLAGLNALPYLPVPESISARKEQAEQVRRQAESLQKSIRKLAQQKPNQLELKRLLAESEKASRELQKPSTNKVEALKKLNALQDKWNQIHKELDRSRQKTLAQSLPEPGNKGASGTSLTDAQKEELQQLAKDVQKALGNQQDAGGHEIQDPIAKQQLNPQEIEKLKKALENYKTEKAESEKMMTELQRTLENAQKGIASGSHKLTTDSTLSERDLEKGKSGVADGPGTTNLDVGPQQFDTKKHGKSEYVEDRTKAQYEPLYKGEREKTGSEPLFLDSQWNNEPSKYVRIRSFGLDSDATVKNVTTGTVPQNQEESEIRKEKIPASYQKIIKKYFEAIQE